MNFIMIC